MEPLIDIDLTPFENNENVTVEMCLQMMHMMKEMMVSMSTSMESMAQTIASSEKAHERAIQQLTNQLALANEQINHLNKKLFGRSKEALSNEVTGQLNLFLMKQASKKSAKRPYP